MKTWSTIETNAESGTETSKRSWSNFARALCRAFGLAPKTADFGLHNTAQIGSWSCDAVPVILTIQGESQGLRLVIAELGLRLHRPYILLGPTNHHLDARCQELLAHAGAAYFALENTVIVTNNGNLHAIKTPGDLFAKFNPDPEPELNEAVPLQVFAVVKALECEQPCRWPSAFTVLSMYCKEELSAGQIARKCQCSKATIISRLNLLRRRLGCHPARLRQYSAHFERIEESLSDPRAKAIYRKGAINGGE